MEAVAEFDVGLAWVVPVETAEGLAVIELNSAVRDVHQVDRSGQIVSESFA